MRAAFYPLSIAAGEALELTAPGGFFRLFNTTGDLRVQFPELGWEIKAVPSGVGFPIKGGFSNIRLVNETGSTVTGRLFVATEGVQTDRIEGEVIVSKITDPVRVQSVTGGTLDAVTVITDPVQVSGITNPVPQAVHEIGGIAAGAVATKLSVLQTIVTPAANTAGVVVNVAALSAGAGDGAVRLMAKDSAPTDWADTAAATLLFARTDGTHGESLAENAVTLPLRVPAGMGLYVQGSSVGDFKDYFVIYEVL